MSYTGIMADKPQLYTYTNMSKDQEFMVPNLGLLKPGETSRATEMILNNVMLKQAKTTEEAENKADEKETPAKDNTILRGIDRTSKKDTDEVKDK